jgi:hypothetical protein
VGKELEMQIGETVWFGNLESAMGVKSELRKRMEALSVGEGFDVTSETSVSTFKEKRKAQAIANNLNPKGIRFSVRWLPEKKTFRVIRTR